jgi:glycosyltransferase involved in cell wall biosynthesis
MIIAVNTRLHKDEQPEGYEQFLFEILGQLTKKFTQHRFLFIFDKPCNDNLKFDQNVLPVIIGPETKSSLRLQYWFNYKVPAVLRKHKAGVFVSMEGICSLRTKIPQCLVLTQLDFLQSPGQVKKSQARFFKKFTPAFLAKAKAIATVSGFSRSLIAGQYKINPADIDIINPGIADIFKPVDWEEKERIKEKYAEGKAYFLFSADIDRRSNIINLLKAFSFFKKRQKSNMMLLLAGNADELFKKELKTYKYRNEVILLENLATEELAKVTAAAYAMVYPVLYADLALAPLQAMKCEVPVIAANAGALPSICGNAVLYANPGDFKDIAENMMLVFKDEDKAAELVNAGKIMVGQYDWDKSADLLMRAICKAFNN